jgi:hypothetical protein
LRFLEYLVAVSETAEGLETAEALEAVEDLGVTKESVSFYTAWDTETILDDTGGKLLQHIFTHTFSHL